MSASLVDGDQSGDPATYRWPPTRKHFWEDPRQTRWPTRISAVQGDWVSLEESIFFAFSGGQESDTGSIAGQAVLEARKLGRALIYLLAPGHGLVVGQVVEVQIDWPRRHALMRLHFAAELVLELIYRQFPGIEKVGAHIGERKARIDFRHSGPLTAALPALQDAANEIIAARRVIRCAYQSPTGPAPTAVDAGTTAAAVWPVMAAGADSRSASPQEENGKRGEHGVREERRYWEIDGFARVPCGGTHVRDTGEVGAIALRRRNVGKGIERVEISLQDMNESAGR